VLPVLRGAPGVCLCCRGVEPLHGQVLAVGFALACCTYLDLAGRTRQVWYRPAPCKQCVQARTNSVCLLVPINSGYYCQNTFVAAGRLSQVGRSVYCVSQMAVACAVECVSCKVSRHTMWWLAACLRSGMAGRAGLVVSLDTEQRGAAGTCFLSYTR
jgi:hypothetical protein